MNRYSMLPFLLMFFALSTSVPAAEPAGIASDPCCSITHINARTGLVTARDTTNRRTIQFKVLDAGLLKGLRLGQKVFAGLGSQQVSLDGAAPCCSIVAMQAEPAGVLGQAAQNAGGSENPGSGSTKPGSGRKTKDSVQLEAERRVCKDRGGEWRCTTIATGSSPGPEDDTQSCVCIFSDRPKS